MKVIEVLSKNAPIGVRKPALRQVDVRNRDELTMWCRRLGVTPLQLCSVVDRVGSDALDVENALRSSRRAA